MYVRVSVSHLRGPIHVVHPWYTPSTAAAACTRIVWRTSTWQAALCTSGMLRLRQRHTLVLLGAHTAHTTTGRAHTDPPSVWLHFLFLYPPTHEGENKLQLTVNSTCYGCQLSLGSVNSSQTPHACCCVYCTHPRTSQVRYLPNWELLAS